MTIATKDSSRTFQVRSYRPEDLPAVLDVMRSSLGESKTLERSDAMWNWKHRDNWFGHSHVLVATGESGEVVGLRAFMRWRYLRDDQQFEAVRAVDTSTHPDYQRLGMFSKLTLQAVEDVRTDGTDFVFNTPNDRSRPGYLKMGWTTVGNVKPMVKVLNYPKFTFGLAKHKFRRDKDEAPVHSKDAFVRGAGPKLANDLLGLESLKALITADNEGRQGQFRTDRSVEFFRWRYAQHPTIKYGAAWIEQDGQLTAAAIFRFNSRFGMREIVLSEVLLFSPDRKLAKVLLNEVSRVSRGDYMITYAAPGSPQSSVISGAGFRRLPIGAMTLTYNPLSSRVPEKPGLSDWAVGMGDLEFF